MNKEEFWKALKDEDWEYFLERFDIGEIIKSFSFKECMIISCELQAAHCWEGNLEKNAIDLMQAVRECFKKEWQLDWKNEVLLGGYFSLNARYEEGFNCVKKLLDSFQEPPHSLILDLLFVSSAPDALLSKEEEMNLARRAYKMAKTAETATAMACAHDRNSERLKSKWFRMLARRLEKKKIYSPIILPDVLKEEVALPEGYTYEI